MSNRTERHDKIQQITAKLIELNNNFANAQQLTAVDIGLLQKYAVDLYDEILLLEPEKAVVQPDAPVTTPKIVEPEVKEEPVVNSTPEPEPVEEIKKVPPPAPKVEEKKEETPVAEEPKPVEEPKAPIEEPAAKAETAEQEEEKDNSLNSSLQQPEKNDLASKLGQTPIHDLKKAISINKKFEFISQLFEGDHEGYTKSVHYLNGLSNKDEAMNFFNSLKSERNWDEENKRFIEFADLVNRRFM
jgi:type IV secretory pathway VirB10-like protein